ncbi:cell wall protein Cwp1p [Monosporozyma unispora]
MKFTTALSLPLLALANIVVADSENFNLMVLQPNSDNSMSFLQDVNSVLNLTDGYSPKASTVVTDAGALKFSSGKYAVVGSDGKISLGDSSVASTGFAIDGGRLTYKTHIDFFRVTNSDSSVIIYTNRVDGADGITFSPRNPKTDNTAHDFPSTNGTVSNNNSSSSSTVTISSNVLDNSAPRFTVGAGVSALAMVAGLLL